MTLGQAGCSGTPLYKKLGIKPQMNVLVIDGLRDYEALVSGVEPVAFTHADLAHLPGRHYPVVHLFCADTAALQASFDAASRCVAEGGMIWVSWPKKSSNLFRDLTEDHIRAQVLPGGIWVDVKVCAVTADWSGLKFLRRKR